MGHLSIQARRAAVMGPVRPAVFHDGSELLSCPARSALGPV